MKSMQTELTFEPSGRSGLVAVGTYLSDAARRLGVEIFDENEENATFEAHIVKIVKGAELLSAPTKIENEYLTPQKLDSGQRLAGQAKIEKGGEITVMVAKKKKEEKPDETERMDEFRKEFNELPLEKKVANLIELEAVTFSETVKFVLDSPYMIVGKIMDVMAEFGLKMEKDEKNAKRPSEHFSEETESDDKKKQSRAGGKKTSKKSADKAENETENKAEDKNQKIGNDQTENK